MEIKKSLLRRMAPRLISSLRNVGNSAISSDSGRIATGRLASGPIKNS
jgi:hypothetical protein